MKPNFKKIRVSVYADTDPLTIDKVRQYILAHGVEFINFLERVGEDQPGVEGGTVHIPDWPTEYDAKLVFLETYPYYTYRAVVHARDLYIITVSALHKEG